MEIPQDDVPRELRVWAIPDEARRFRDDVIVMIQNNPTPLVLPVITTGARPIVEIVDGAVVKFERLLLKQTAKKDVKLRNSGLIPVKWRILGLESLPEEFKLENTSGELKPTQETVIEVRFKAITQ